MNHSPNRIESLDRSQQRVAMAAQADLILLTVDMLRAPDLKFGKPAWANEDLQTWQQCLAMANFPASTVADKTTLAESLSEIFSIAQATTVDQWSDEYWRLFDSSMACPINQAAYVRREKGTILGDLSGFYLAFGWEHVLQTGERPDHLLCQLEFIAVMLAMAVQAQTDEQSEIAREALGKFAQTHMHDWLPSFCWQLCEVTQLPLFGAIGTWLVMLWDALTAVHAWPVDPRPAERIEVQQDIENPYECAAGGLVQLGEH